MSRNLCDETFPASLLIEFDELDDEIPISPELPKRHPPGAFPQHHSTLTGAPTAEHASDKGHHETDDRNGSRMVISGSSNTSSGHSSLSTEGETRSASSDRDSSRDLSKRQLTTNGVHDGEPGNKLLLKPRKFGPPRSMESLLQDHSGGGVGRSLRKLIESPQDTTTGLGGMGVNSSSSGNISVGNGSTQPYNRNRKYGHVQSKVKQLIDEMKPSSNRDRKSLVRHKSLPNTYEPNAQDEADEEALEQETNLEMLRVIIREMKQHTRTLEQELSMRDLYHENVFNELATLKCKNSALRMENDQLHEQERSREQRRQVLRQCDRHAGSCYGSQSSLHKASLSVCTVGTQTSPREDEFVDRFRFPASPDQRHTPSTIGARSSLSAGRNPVSSAVVAQPTGSAVNEPESPEVAVVGEFSPDYEQLIPMLGRGNESSSSFLSDLRFREQRALRSPPRTSVGQSDTPDAQHEYGNGPGCRDCRKRRKKRKSRKHKLASLFCIRRHDESL